MTVFFFKQKTAYEMRISDCSSDVCSSDLCLQRLPCQAGTHPGAARTDPAAARPALAAPQKPSPCDLPRTGRSEERRAGKEGDRTCRSRWSPDPSQNKEEYTSVTVSARKTQTMIEQRHNMENEQHNY